MTASAPAVQAAAGQMPRRDLLDRHPAQRTPGRIRWNTFAFGRAFVDRGQRHLERAAAGEQDPQRLGMAPPHHLHELEPVRARHLHVEDDHARVLLADLPPRTFGVLGDGDVDVRNLERRSQELQ